MISYGKKNILGILVDALDYEAAVEQIIEAAKGRRGFAVSTADVHGVMVGVLSHEQKFRLNHLDLVTPDGQPVRWVLKILHGVELAERVGGPKLTLRLCERAEKENLGVFFYGNTKEVLSALRNALQRQFPRLRISGMEPSKFRRLSHQEQDRVSRQIRESGASLVFVGLGCPRQDVWAYEYRELLSLPIVAVGGAFGVLAGKVPRAPEWMQDRGLEWFFRLWLEPRRLWRRYLLLNPAYILLIASQALGLKKFTTDGDRPTTEVLYG
jgi:exopolysaccharide biosynthesis WecB/TagA/CpsF family protein